MTPQELRNSIFRQAFQGKLVPQIRTDGTAEDTLSFVKYKAVKSLDDQYDLPENWRWTYLIDLAEILYGFPFNSEKFNETNIGMPLIRIRDINNGYSNTYTDEVCEERYRIVKGDMLVGMDGNFQVSYWNSQDAWLNQRVCKITANNQVLIQNYLYYYLPLILKEINGTVSYSTVKHLSAKILNQLLIPLPPIAEQKRIVAKLEEILPLIDRFEAAWNKLEEFNKRFPSDMQKSILQLAIQGKLVEQRSDEGTGEELFQQIQAKKQALIKSGKIKKEKPLPEISDDEIPFDIPHSWKWVRFSEVIDVRDGTHDTPKYVTDGVPLVTSKNLVDGEIDFDTTKLISYEDAEQINMRSGVDNGDILFAMIGTIGNPVLVKKDREFCIKNMALFKAVSQDLLDMNYLLLFLQNEQHAMKKKASGGVQSFVSLKFLRNYLLPLPPVAEQKRIVAKLEEILPLCERLK